MHFLDGADPAADRQRHKDCICHAADQPQRCLSALLGCGDIQEDQLIGTLLVIKPRLFDGIACISQVDKVDPFYQAAIFDIEAGNNAFC